MNTYDNGLFYQNDGAKKFKAVVPVVTSTSVSFVVFFDDTLITLVCDLCIELRPL